MRSSTSDRPVLRFFGMIADKMYRVCVERNDQTFAMAAITELNRTFNHFLFARYTTDVIFQQINRPVGRMQE